MSHPYPISDELKQFFVAIQQWIDSGCPIYDTFVRSVGLCNNFEKFGQGQMTELKDLLELEFGDGGYPFGGPTIYCKEQAYYKMYQNPERLAFIRKYATS